MSTSRTAMRALLLAIALQGVLGPVEAQTQAEKTVESTGTLSKAGQLNLHLVKAEAIAVQTPIVGTGTVFSHKASKIGPLVEGQVVTVHVKVGDRVKKEQPLFEIRPHTYSFRYEDAKARINSAQALVKESKLALRRSERLLKNNNVSEATHDRNRRILQVAEAQLEVAKVGLKHAKQNLDDTVVYAPFNGVITARLKDEGVYLSTLLTGGGGNAVVELQKVDVVVAIVQVPSRELEKMYLGAPVSLVIDGIAKPVEATITVINDKVDIATRTVEVRMRIPNGDYAIKPGLFVRAEIEPKSRNAVVIPRHAVQGVTDSRYVFVLVRGKAMRKNVRVVDYDATRVEVMSGLAYGERILIGPDMPKLSDGLAIGEVPDVAG